MAEETKQLLSNGEIEKSQYSSLELESKPKLSYKSKVFQSSPAFETLVVELEKNQKNFAGRIFRSSSEPKLDAVAVEAQGRRALYGMLPFVAAFGMQHRENKLRRVISSASTTALEHLELNGTEHAHSLSEVDVDEIILTFPLIMAVIVAILAQFLVGFNTGVMNAPADVVFPGHSTTQWSLAVSAFAVGGPFGALLGGILANKRGRRGAMLINVWIFLLGGTLLSLAPTVYWLIPARFIIGFASGIGSVVVPVYLGEIAPPTLRGTLGTCTQFALVIGILMSDVFAFPFATLTRWRYLFAVTPFVCVLQLLVSPFLLESPRWLLNLNKNSAEARIAIKQLRGFRTEAEVEQETDHFLFAASQHRTPHQSAHSSGAMWDLLTHKELRVLVVSSIVLQVGQQLCGINAVFYYSSLFFKGIIDDPLMGTTMVAFVNVLATYVALKLMDSSKRRSLLIVSSVGMLISTFVLMLALQRVISNSYVALGAVMIFVSFFEIGLGPIPWLIVAEMFNARYVATAMSMACVVNWGCNFLVGFGFPFLQQYLGIGWCFAPFAGVLALMAIFTFTYLPETHGRTVDEIQKMVSPDEMDVETAIQIVAAIHPFNMENSDED